MSTAYEIAYCVLSVNLSFTCMSGTPVPYRQNTPDVNKQTKSMLWKKPGKGERERECEKKRKYLQSPKVSILLPKKLEDEAAHTMGKDRASSTVFLTFHKLLKSLLTRNHFYQRQLPKN